MYLPGVMRLVLKLPACFGPIQLQAVRSGSRLTARTSQVGCLLARLLAVMQGITGLAWPMTLHGLL